MKIYLASESPRRKELFQKFFTSDFESIHHKCNEKLLFKEISSKKYSAQKLTRAITEGKLNSIDKTHLPQEAIIIAGDTVVTHKDNIYGKPYDLQEAFEMLSLFSNSCVKVIGAIGIYDHKNQKLRIENVITKIFFDKIESQKIESYITNSCILDKAGGFGIQDKAAYFIREIQGDYYNAVGLPVNRLYQMLKPYKLDFSDE